MTTPPSDDAAHVSRRAQIAANVTEVRGRVASACTAAGRAPDEVTVIAVSKTYPAVDVLHLAALGLTDVGENRDQEAAAKADEVRAAGVDVRWHYIGQLQRNKCRSVVRYAAMVHSVDNRSLAQALGRAADGRPHRPLDVLVQVSIDGDGSRGGAVEGSGSPDNDLDQVAEAVASQQSLRLRGVMAVAPLSWEPDAAFARLSEIRARFIDRYPTATVLSAGMSGDLEVAVRYGATHVRIGAALLGSRPALR